MSTTPALQPGDATAAGALCDWSGPQPTCTPDIDTHTDTAGTTRRPQGGHTMTDTTTHPGPATPEETVSRNLDLMKQADDAFNARDYERFLDDRHHPRVVVHQTGLPGPSHTLAAHRSEIETLIRAFPDVHVHNDPYDIAFGQGEWTTAIGRLTGTFSGGLVGPDGTPIPPTGRSFDVAFTTIARWQHGRIVEERVLWDNGLLLQQIGLPG